MDLKAIEYFAVLAQRGSFTQAAETLYITQPALSRKIAELEEELGCLLFHRHTRPIQLTQAGKAFKRHAQIILSDMEALKEDMDRIVRSKSQETQTLTIGYGMAGHMPYLAEAVAAMKKKQSHVQIKLLRMFNSSVLENLKEGRLDVGIVNLPEPEEEKQLAYASVYPCGLVAFVSSENKLAKRESITIQEIAKEPLMLFERVTSQRQYDAILRLIPAKKPNICCHAPDTSAFSMMLQVEKGLVGIMPATTTVMAQSIRAIPILDTHGFDMAMVWRKDSENPAISLFLKELVSL